jgi:ketosteroid isomerase-like protein
MTDDTTLQALLEREAIRDLVYRHTDAANRGDLDTIRDSYAPPALPVWSPSPAAARWMGPVSS